VVKNSPETEALSRNILVNPAGSYIGIGQLGRSVSNRAWWNGPLFFSASFETKMGSNFSASI
jgi:hypothetical protein